MNDDWNEADIPLAANLLEAIEKHEASRKLGYEQGMRDAFNKLRAAFLKEADLPNEFRDGLCRALSILEDVEKQLRPGDPP